MSLVPREPDPAAPSGAPAGTAREGGGRHAPAWLPFAALALLVAAVTAWIQTLAWDTGTYTNDEVYSVVGARLLEGDVFPLLYDLSGFFNRGPERLNSVLIAVAVALTDDAPSELRLAHVLLGLAYALAAVPVFALARMLGLGRWPAVLTAALTVVTPWILFGATLLNVTVGIPLTLVFVWAVCRAASSPSIANDLLVLVAAGLNTLARTGHAPFAVVAVLAVVYAVWLRRPAAEPVGRSLLRLPARVLRTHPLLTVVATVAAAIVVSVGSKAVVGPAYESVSGFRLRGDMLWLYLRQWFLQLTTGTGYLPMLVGVPWLLRQAVRPTDPRAGTFAVVALGLFVVFTFVTANITAAVEERYVAPLAALPVLAFAAALFRREAWPLGTVLVGLLAARALATVELMAERTDYLYQVAPSRLFFYEVVLGRVRVLLPAGDERALLVTTVAMVAVATAVAVLVRHGAAARREAIARHRNALVVALSVPVLALGGATAAYALQRYERAVFPEKSFEDLAAVDRASGGRPTFLWAHFWPQTRDGRIYMGQYVQHFNRSVCCTLWLNDVQDLLGPRGELPGEPTRHLARFAGFLPLAFETEELLRTRIYGVETVVVERFRGPARAFLRVEGAEPDGAVQPGRPAVLRLLPGSSSRGRCLSVVLGSPVDARRTLGFRVQAGRRTVSGTLPPTTGRTVRLPLAGATLVRVHSTRRGGRDLLRFGEIDVTRC